MKYRGRIVLMTVVLALIAAARVYGSLYYKYPIFNLPYIGIPAILIYWWLGSQYDKVKFYSEKDVLTGIYNRRFVIQTFPKLLSRIDKRDGQLGLFLMDVDNFKKINDTYGHEKGDQVLQSISRILVSNTTKVDIVSRWAGDEFLVISPCTEEKHGDRFMKQMTSALQELSKELNIEVSVSIGNSTYPNDAKTLDALLNSADRNLYAMKSK